MTAVTTTPARVGIARTVLCGSLSRFASPLGAAMHNAAYATLDLPWHYVPFEIGPDDLERALTGMRALGIRGFGISMPFKQQIMPLLDAIDPVAGRIGAVNTVVNDDGKLTGHNTDWQGAMRALEEVTELDNQRVVLLGAGGAARAIAFGLKQRGASVTLCNRTESKVHALAEDTGAQVISWSERAAACDVLINATSLGMTDIHAESPIAPSDLACSVAMDIVYKPVDTELVRAARAKGIRTVHGGRMLLHQAARQHEIYTQRKAPLDAMATALEQAMRDE